MNLQVVPSPSKNDTHEQLSQIRDSVEECSEMDGSMSISGQVSGLGVTTFANEACDSVELLSSYVPSSLRVPQSDLQDLKAYFERPRLMARGSLPFGTRSPNFTKAFSTVSSFVDVFPQWTQRLSGVYGITFSMDFRLQVAATAFHQGVITMAWQYATNGALVNSATYNRLLSSASVTNLPHVRLDLAESTMVELKIPFLYTHEFFPVTESSNFFTYPYGVFGLNTILPLISTSGITTPTYEIYLSLSDVQLYGADNASSTSIVLQSGVIQKEIKTNHLLSKGLSATAKISRFVGTHIPSLSAVAGPVAWAADTAAGVARFFGYSRPMIQDPPLKVLNGVGAVESNVDVPMAGSVLGLMQSNTLAVSPEFGGTNIDEMSLNFVLTQWSQINVAYVDTTDIHGKVIYASATTPSSFWFRQPANAPYCNKRFPVSSNDLVSNSGNVFLPSSVMYFSSLFRLWRGGFKFRFTFAKTKLHGGRYMVSFNPRASSATTPVDTPNTIEGPENAVGLVQPYGYSMIIDLKDGNVFEFDVPYVSEVLYSSFNSSSGSISLVCIDPLIATSTVTSSVPVLVEVKASDDYELADFAGNYLLPQASALIYQQSGVKTTTKEPAQQTIGEKITSLKQLIQSPWWAETTIAAGATANTYLCPWYTWIPAAPFNASNQTAPNIANLDTSGAGSVAGAVSKCFVFAKGGTDVHAYVIGNSDSIMMDFEQIPQEYKTSDNSSSNYTIRSLNSSTPRVISIGPYGLHVRLPAFQLRTRVPTPSVDRVGFKAFGSPSSPESYSRSHFDVFKIRNASSSASRYILSRAAADDAALSHYIGPSPVYIPNTVNVNAIERDWTI